MAYHIYHTEAIILDSRPFGEGDRLLHCYTRELGYVVAHAKSLRELRSRLRYSLQTFAHAEIDLIRGKHGWKLISARPLSQHQSLLEHARKRTILAQHTQLVRRLIQGEESHATLFDDLLAALRFLDLREVEEEFRAAELLFVVRLLERLGYWEGKEELALLLTPNVWDSTDALHLVTRERTHVLTAVNAALRATQL